jgi:phage gp36-like protein
MPYITTQDMIDEFGEREVIALSDRIDAGEVAADVVDRAIVGACSEVDAYVAAKVAIPLTKVSPIVKRHVCNITRYHLTGSEAEPTEEIRNRYKDAVKFFTAVGKGEVQLGVDVAGDAASGRGTVMFPAGTNAGAGGRVFSRGAGGDII